MPIRPEMKEFYLPKKEWEALRAARLEKQQNRCLWCDAPNHQIVYRDAFNCWHYDWENPIDGLTGLPLKLRAVKIVLTIAHLDHNPQNNIEENTPALCQKCHNSWDAEYRARKRIERQDARKIAEYNARMQK